MDTTTDTRLEDAHKALTDGIAALVSSDDWKRYLATQSRFHKYSFGNVMWLMGQAITRGVDVTRFAGYRTWQSLGRQVRKGEKAFHVLAPLKFKKSVEKDGVKEDVYGIRGWRVESTFDISQTDGEPLPEVAKDLQGSSEEIRSLTAKLAAWSASRGVPVTFPARPAGETADGLYYRAGRIEVFEGMSDLQTFRVLVHEVAHSILHAKEEDRHGRPQNEVEAESTAFIVFTVLGFDASEYSFGYVAGWSEGDTKLVKSVGERIQKAAKEILSVLKKDDAAE